MPIKYDVDKDYVVELSGKELESLKYKSVNLLTAGQKRFMIKQVWGNGPAKKACCIPKSMLSDEDLAATYEFLSWNYQQQDVRVAKASICKLVCDLGTETEEGLYSVWELKDQLKQAKWLILTIHATSPLHWTFIVVKTKEQGSEEITEVRYIDWLYNVEENRYRALVVWHNLSEGKFGPLPSHCNLYRQAPGSNDCGLALWHTLEDIMKYNRGEGLHTNYPDPPGYRKKLDKLLEKIALEKDAWDLELASGKKAKVVIEIPGSVIEDRSAYAAKVKKLSAEGKLIHEAEKFISCGSCRWTNSGLGCLYCNSAKKEENLKSKQKELKQLATALDDAMKAAGLSYGGAQATEAVAAEVVVGEDKEYPDVPPPAMPPAESPASLKQGDLVGGGLLNVMLTISSNI